MSNLGTLLPEHPHQAGLSLTQGQGFGQVHPAVSSKVSPELPWGSRVLQGRREVFVISGQEQAAVLRSMQCAVQISLKQVEFSALIKCYMQQS